MVYREEILEFLGDNAKFAKGNNNLNMAGSVAELGYEAALREIQLVMRNSRRII